MYDPQAVLRATVSLRGVRWLSVGKVSQAPITKGKGKAKGKSKGSGKSGSGKDASGAGAEPCIPVYLGQDGYTICTMVSKYIMTINRRKA